MSYQSEHQRMKPVLDLACRLDIATNPDPSAIFEVGNAGFQVWATLYDHPQGWRGIPMTSGAFSKPCEYVGSVHWKWEQEEIVALFIETTAYALAEQKPNEFNAHTIINRHADLEWLKEKATWLFEKANVPLLRFEYQKTSWSEPDLYRLAQYEKVNDQYVVIVCPQSDPMQFCWAGYHLVRTMEIGTAADFCTDVILHPESDHVDEMIRRKPAPTIGQSQCIGATHEDAWLEAAFEDRVSGELDIEMEP